MAIENPWLLQNLCEQMRELDYSQQEIDQFAMHWDDLKPNQPIPCPVCFTDGIAGSLRALNAVGNVEPVKCRDCGTRFDIPIPGQ